MKAITRWTGTAAVAVALGFGASQAVAAPAEPEAAQTCSKRDCNTRCRAAGAESGSCVGGQCVCITPV
jgi:hypothetical protein